MNVLLRAARASALLSPTFARRAYATETTGAPSLRLTFALPHQTLYQNTEVQQVNISSTSGDMGILAIHVPSIEQLKPGVVEVLENPTTTKKYFVSGGFAIVNPNSTLDINAVEAFPLEDFSVETVKANLAEAQRVANGSGPEEEKVTAAIEVEVYEALQAALASR